MTNLWRCDWCQEVTDDRDDVVMVDFDQRPESGNALHVHPECLPDDVRERMGFALDAEGGSR